jgi:phage baseplate assembly protein W
LHEQDSRDEISACVFAVLNTPLGHRTDLPEFGRPGQAHKRGGADLAGLERAVALWEPRADLIALRESGLLAEMAREAGLDTVRIEGR